MIIKALSFFVKEKVNNSWKREQTHMSGHKKQWFPFLSNGNHGFTMLSARKATSNMRFQGSPCEWKFCDLV